jgi:hypothetical protein
MLKYNPDKMEFNKEDNKDIVILKNFKELICKECMLRSVDVTKEDLDKHDKHILINKNLALKKMIGNIDILKKMFTQKCISLDELCYICKLTNDIDIEDLGDLY